MKKKRTPPSKRRVPSRKASSAAKSVKAKGASAGTAPRSTRSAIPEVLAWHNKTDDTAADQIRASRSRPSAALQSTAASRFAGAGGHNVDAQTIPVPVPITPTVYPDQPDGTVIVQNYITINIQSVEFRDFKVKVGKILNKLSSLNNLSPEVRDQLRAEITAGRALLTAPKPHRTWIELLLKGPLSYIAAVAGGAVIGKIAVAALELLGRITGLW